MIGFITGSGFYDYPRLEKKVIETPFGSAEILVGESFVILPKHGEGHKMLPHHVNYRANIAALKKLGVKAIVSFSVVGVVDENMPLAKPLVVSDLYFPENRLPHGDICSMFSEAGDEMRGHLIAGSFFHSGLRAALKELTDGDDAVYAHVNGPRFNSKIEIAALQQTGAQIISQTCGPEVILANELEVPYAMLAFPVDYANGVKDTPTPIEVLNENLKKSKDVFSSVVEELPKRSDDYSFEGFIYRFE